MNAGQRHRGRSTHLCEFAKSLRCACYLFVVSFIWNPVIYHALHNRFQIHSPLIMLNIVISCTANRFATPLNEHVCVCVWCNCTDTLFFVPYPSLSHSSPVSRLSSIFHAKLIAKEAEQWNKTMTITRTKDIDNTRQDKFYWLERANTTTQFTHICYVSYFSVKNNSWNDSVRRTSARPFGMFQMTCATIHM